MINGQGSLLVVDDDEANRDMLSRRLQRKGYDVAAAHDGRRALEMIKNQPFELVLLDVMMPGLDGLEVLEILRKTHSATDLPVIMATARDKSEDVVAALELGANDYVTKPLDFPVVLARVRTHLSLRRAVEQVRALKRGLAERNRDLETAKVRMSLDLRAAAKVQAALLPRVAPNLPGASIAWAFRPCDELAGDGLNVVRLDATRVGLYILDVSGHGVASALLSVSITRFLSPPADPASILGRHDGSPASPAEVVDQLNRLFPFDLVTHQYFTLVYAVVDVATGELRYASAGHPGPIHSSAVDGSRLLDGRGYPVGFAEARYEERSVRLEPGDRVYLYSDGVTEAIGLAGVQFGSERLLHATERDRVEPLDEAVVRLRTEVEEWCEGLGVRDDVSILALELSADAGDRPGLATRETG